MITKPFRILLFLASLLLVVLGISKLGLPHGDLGAGSEHIVICDYVLLQRIQSYFCIDHMERRSILETNDPFEA